MSNKYLRYSLIVAVIAVWATIGYRVVHGLSDPVLPPTERKPMLRENYNLKEDSFKLYADYPDPFLPDSDADPKDTSDRKSDPPSSPLPPSLPATENMTIKRIIVYNGMISNPKRKSRVAIVTIQGKEYMVREKETVDEIKILKIANDKLLISYRGEVYTIGK